MYDFNGCQCPVCNQYLREDDDLVVCPDCGAPYHRSCYAEQGQCSFAARHGADFEWMPPRRPEAKKELACPRCGAMNDEDSHFCKSCGQELHPLAQEPRPSAAPKRGEGPYFRDESGNVYDYRTMYAQAVNMHVAGMGIDPQQELDGITAAEWCSYIGPASKRYLPTFLRMEQAGHKYSLSLSAFLFGPLYFFYRKAWRPAIVCSVITAVLSIPSFLLLLVLTESSLAAGLDTNLVYNLGSIFSLISIAYRFVRGAFGDYLYRLESADRIRRIQQQYPDPQKRAFVLGAQGGTSPAVVALVVGVTYLGIMAFSMLLGPNIDALYQFLSL